MIKRLGKTKKSKQGAILVVVVLILALAMIFIASALMLTQATRNRLYGNAMSSQARLTVTAASEVFWEAVEMQEITDAQIDAILAESPKGTNPDNSHTDENKIRMEIAGVPGMTAADDNCTLLDLYYPNYPNKEVVYADFKTTIGDQVENIRLCLGVSEVHKSSGGRFKNQIDIGSGTTDTQLRYTHGVGMIDPALEAQRIADGNPITDNTILVRGSSKDTTSDAVFYSDIVYAKGGDARFGADSNEYHGRMVFLEGSQFDIAADGSSVIPHIYGDMYFIGDGTDEGSFVNNTMNGWSRIESKNMVFSNRFAENDNTHYSGVDVRNVKDMLSAAGRSCYFLDGEGNLITVSNVDYSGSYTISNGSNFSDVSSNLSVYKDYAYNSTDPFPTNVLTDVFCEINPDGLTKKITAGTELTRDEYEIIYDEEQGRDIATFYAKGSVLDHDIEAVKNPLTTTYPSYKKNSEGNVPTDKKISFDSIHSKCTSGYWDVPVGYYQFTPGTSTSGHLSKPDVICIDGSKAGEYRFYFAAGTYNINDLVFAVYNVSSEPTPVVFILEPGAKLLFNNDAQYRTSNCLAGAGFISVSRGKSSAADIANYVRNTKRCTLIASGGEEKVWSSEHKMTASKGGAQITYSQFYDGVAKPCIFVYGTGANTFTIGDSCTFEAYIGLYGGSKLTKNSGLSNETGYKINIYGRIEADKFAGGNNAVGAFQMPYCPGPNPDSGDSSDKVAVTKFHVSNVAYYY